MGVLERKLNFTYVDGAMPVGQIAMGDCAPLDTSVHLGLLFFCDLVDIKCHRFRYIFVCFLFVHIPVRNFVRQVATAERAVTFLSECLRYLLCNLKLLSNISFGFCVLFIN